jgi:uncharacterized protein (TIGR03437 family)
MVLKSSSLLKSMMAVLLILTGGIIAPPATAQRRQWLQDLIKEQQRDSGPRGVLTAMFDAWVRGDRLHVRSASLPLTTPYQEFTFDRPPKKLAAEGDHLYVWIEGDRLLQFTLDAAGRLNAPQAFAVDYPEAVHALERARAIAITVPAPKTAEATRPDSSVVVNPPLLFVANSGGTIAGKISGDSVSAINTATDTYSTTMQLTAGSGPTAVVVAPDNSKGYIANYGLDCSSCVGRGVTPFSPSTQVTSAPPLAAQYPYSLAISSDGTRLAVGDFTTLRIFDQNGNQLVSSDLQVPIVSMVMSPDNQSVYVLRSGTETSGGTTIDSVVIAPVATAQSSTQLLLPTNSGCVSIVVSPDGRHLYVGCYITPSIFSIQISGGALSQGQVISSNGVGGLAISPDGNTLYATYVSANTVDVLNASTLTRQTLINTQLSPIAMVASADGTRGYVANYNSNSVSVLDLTNNIGLTSVAVGPGPFALALTTPPPVIAATPLQLTFTGSAGQANPTAQNVALSVSLTGTTPASSFTWNATATTNSGGNWLTVGTATGSFPATLAVSVNTTGLTPGNYTGTVSIASSNTGNTPLAISVALTVNPSGVLAVDQKQLSFSVTAGSPSPAPATVNLTSSGTGGSIAWSAVVSPAASWLSLTPSSGVTPAALTIGVNPQGLTAGQLSATVTVSSSGALNPVQFTVSLTVLPGPSIPAGGIVNAASFTASLGAAPGSIISIFGSNMGPTTGVGASAIPLPTSLSNVQVTIGGYSAPLFYVSASQINCQVPFEAAGQTTVPVVVQNGSASSAPSSLTISAASPGIFTGVVNGQSVGAILNQDYSQNTPSNPAHVGQVIQIFANGQGVVSNQPADGAPAPAGPLAMTAGNPTVLIGGQPAPVAFSGLSPNFVGLWQINVTVPATVTPGTAVSVQIVQGTAASNAANVAIVSP